MATGRGDRLTCATVGFEAVGIRIGDEVRGNGVGVGATGVIGEAVADTCDVCGSLGPLLNGLKSQEGANLDANVTREEAGWELRGVFEEPTDRLERNDLIDDCEGDVLSVVTASVLGILFGVSSCGKSTIIRFGLSSMGSIRVGIIEFLCEFLLSLRSEAELAVALTVDIIELRAGFENFDSGLKAKISISNFSASSFEGAMSPTVSLEGDSGRSGMKGTSILERTSSSKSPNI